MMSRRLDRVWCLAVGMTTLLLLQVGNRAAAQGAAEGPAATVVAVRGDVLAIGADKAQRALELKGPVFRKDTIKTGARGRVQIMFTDKTTISLGRNTVIELAGYEFKPEQGRGELVTHVQEGVFRVVGGAITKLAPENFKVETSTATIGIRGSYFVGSLNGGELTVILIGGIGIYISNQAGTVEITRPNFGTVVRTAFSRPEVMRPFTVAEIRAFLDRLMGLGPDAGDQGVPRPQGQGDFDPMPGEPGFEGGQQEGEPEVDEYAVVQTILDWLEDESTAASQNGLGNDLGAGGGGGGGNEPPGGLPNYHYGHAIALALGSSGRYTWNMALQNYNDAYSATDDPSDQFQFRTQEGTPGTLYGTGTLNLGVSSSSTGALPFLNASLEQRTVGNYAFDAAFPAGAAGSVTVQSGNIRTATEAMGTTGATNGTWWNWGFWELDFNTAGGDNYTTQNTEAGTPAAYWVAGERTPQAYIQTLMGDPDATGTYAGGARCAVLPTEGSIAEYEGTSNFLVDFNARSVAGELDFMQTGGFSMDVSADIRDSGAGFQGTVTNMIYDRTRSAPLSSSVNGSFFGPSANSLGGTFSAYTTGAQYIGVFAADAQ